MLIFSENHEKCLVGTYSYYANVRKVRDACVTVYFFFFFFFSGVFICFHVAVSIFAPLLHGFVIFYNNCDTAGSAMDPWMPIKLTQLWKISKAQPEGRENTALSVFELILSLLCGIYVSQCAGIE